MAERWKTRPEGSNWGNFGPDDEYGRLNLLTPEKVLQGIAEVKEGITFCLSLPLNIPGGNVLNPLRHPPQLTAVREDGGYPIVSENPMHTDIILDEMMHLYSQYSSQWDALAHIGSKFDADDDGVPEHVYYNGHKAVSEEVISSDDGRVGAQALGIEKTAEFGLQGRGVLIDLYHHYGDERQHISFDQLMHVVETDGVVVEEGDLVCLHTGSAHKILEMQGNPEPQIARSSCPIIDSTDARTLQWVTETGLVALIADHQSIEPGNIYNFIGDDDSGTPGPALPLHEHCIFKLGVHLGELWYLTELAQWLREHGRSRFLLTAPPLRMPGAAGSPVTPIATV